MGREESRTEKTVSSPMKQQQKPRSKWTRLMPPDKERQRCDDDD